MHVTMKVMLQSTAQKAREVLALPADASAQSKM